ncbi:MAG: winged helix family transcriptional regulator [Mycobacterium sp.]|nr:MAG: winged helix family transcriptional regulator [Mycobacterium sp.]
MVTALAQPREVVPPVGPPPGTCTDGWLDSPLRHPINRLSGEIRRIADAGFVVEVRDESDNLLWTCGGATMWRPAVKILLRQGNTTGSDPTESRNVSFSCLGRSALRVGDACVHLSPRQAEILALLTLRPDGYTPAELSLELYGDRPVSMSTLKAEMSRLRRMIGGGIAAHRYMLTREVCCDAVGVLELLRSGDIVAATERYRGPLLPKSDAPGIIDWRNRLEVAVREAALQTDDPVAAITLGERIDNDPELHEHALKRLRPGDRRRPLIAGRLHVSRRSWQ